MKESEDEEPDTAPLSVGQKNYITPTGLKRIQDELYHLKHKERPEVCAVVSWAAENGDRSENADYQYGKRRLREIDRRIHYLAKRLDSVEVVEPSTVRPQDRVLFGATVRIRDEEGREQEYAIVGVDEVDVERGRVSWVSPIAKALFKAQVGDFVSFQTPRGEREVEVIAIRYESLSE